MALAEVWTFELSGAPDRKVSSEDLASEKSRKKSIVFQPGA